MTSYKMMSWLNLGSMADESSSSDYPSKGIDSSPILANSFSSQQESALEDYITKCEIKYFFLRIIGTSPKNNRHIF